VAGAPFGRDSSFDRMLGPLKIVVEDGVVSGRRVFRSPLHSMGSSFGQFLPYNPLFTSLLFICESGFSFKNRLFFEEGFEDDSLGLRRSGFSVMRGLRFVRLCLAPFIPFF